MYIYVCVSCMLCVHVSNIVYYLLSFTYRYQYHNYHKAFQIDFKCM